MKTLLALTLFLSCLQQILMVNPSDDGTYTLNDCVNKYGVSHEAIKISAKHRLFNTNYNIKCAALCSLKVIGFVDDQGRLLGQELRDRLSDQFRRKALTETINNCTNMTGLNSCDTGFRTMVCMEEYTS